jgi:DNA-damage-inducible protein J
MSSQINVKLEPIIKDKVSVILSELGISVTEAVKIFLHKVVAENGIPFAIKLDYKPNEETIKAIKDPHSEEISIDELWGEKVKGKKDNKKRSRTC